jgi:hypothetical protein
MAPVLDLFFPIKRFIDSYKFFKINQLHWFMLCRVICTKAGQMLFQPTMKVFRATGIVGMINAFKDVHKRHMVVSFYARLDTLKQLLDERVIGPLPDIAVLLCSSRYAVAATRRAGDRTASRYCGPFMLVSIRRSSYSTSDKGCRFPSRYFISYRGTRLRICPYSPLFLQNSPNVLFLTS